ncbi:hypothetical protein HDE_13915 [Halotydeus destructor]|nr:hypothetical protein HDE_13915 [Halotydeus destructor]
MRHFVPLCFLSVLGTVMAASYDYVCYPGDHSISYSYWCDGKYDCDYYDDEDCSEEDKCPYTYWHRCSDSGRCISKSRLCNGYYDCPNGEDEHPQTCYESRSVPTNGTLVRASDKPAKERRLVARNY